jgi:HD-like signal output (HDOD) protein
MKRVLFVDDEESILDGFRRLFRGDRERWELHFASSGEAALHACDAHAFDVVVSDMRMPGMDGATLLGIIRDRFPETARIVLSGYSEEVLATRALSVAHRCLSKPCDPSELRSAIDQVCALEEMLGKPEIRKIVGTVSELPSLSSTYLQLLDVLKTPSTSIDTIVSIVNRDVAMSAKVLQVTNSAFFGLRQRVANLNEAVTYLGIATLKNLVLASEAFRVFVPRPGVPPSMCESLQRHSYATAIIASQLPVPPGLRDITMVAALLHDIGRLFLASVMPDEYCSSLLLSEQNGYESFESEQELLGASHAEIGAYLMGLWGIPFPAIEAIAHHHQPARLRWQPEPRAGGLNCVEAVYCADLIAHELEMHPEDDTGQQLTDRDRSNLEVLGLLGQYPDFRAEAVRALNRTDLSVLA